MGMGMRRERVIWGKNSPHPHLGLESEGRKCQAGSNSHSPCLYRGLNYLAPISRVELWITALLINNCFNTPHKKTLWDNTYKKCGNNISVLQSEL